MNKHLMKAKLEELGFEKFKSFLDEKIKNGELSYSELTSMAADIMDEVSQQLNDWDELLFQYHKGES